MPSPVHDYPLLIVERHLDTFGHVNNATYLQIFEEARWDWITRGGFGLAQVRALGQGPTVLECTLRFQRELLNRTPINVRSWVSSYVGKIARVHQEIQLESGGTACEADFVVGLFDTRARKLIDPTPEWLASVGLTPSDWQPSGPASG
jgi:acyl-CoA thioester hydrolase